MFLDPLPSSLCLFCKLAFFCLSLRLTCSSRRASARSRCGWSAFAREIFWRPKMACRGPKTHPKSRNTKKQRRVYTMFFFRKVSANFCLLPCDTSQEPNGNCSKKLVQMNFFILGNFFGWICLLLALGLRSRGTSRLASELQKSTLTTTVRNYVLCLNCGM